MVYKRHCCIPKLQIFTRLNQFKTRPDQTKPDQTRPDQTRPDQTRPDQTRPDQTRPDQTSYYRENFSGQLESGRGWGTDKQIGK